MMRLSDHFTLAEFTRSKKAELLGIDNAHPTALQIENMRALCVNLLEPLRALLRLKFHPDAVIVLTSGYRCPPLNKAVGGAISSGHPKGEAGDIHVEDGKGNRLMTTQQLFDFVVKSGLEYDQCIQEFDDWLHLSFRRLNRRKAFYAWHDKHGKVRYTTRHPYAFSVRQMEAPTT